MRKLKSLVAILITVLLLCPTVLPAALAQEVPNADVCFTTEGTPSVVGTGETFTVPFNLSKNPGITAAIVYLTYDPAQVEYLSASTENSVIPKQGNVDKVVVNEGPLSSGKHQIAVNIDNPLNVFMNPGSATKYDQTGIVVELNFRVADDFSGQIFIEVDANPNNVVDDEGVPGSYVVSGPDVVIKAIDFSTHEHTYDEGKWESDENDHWQICTECGRESEHQAHVPGLEATEDDPQTCTVCGRVLVEALGHQCKLHLNKVERKEPTCTATGNIEYWECSEDHKKYRDANAEQFVTDDAVILQMIPHTPDNEWHSDETGHWHICTVCETVLDETKTSHTPDGEWHSDGTDHWHVCTECQEEFGKTTHTPDNEWHTDENDHWHVCTVCNSVVDKHEHNPGPAATEEAPQTCTECGYELAPKLEPKYKLGDIDGDGDIDANDYMMLKRHVLRTFKLSDEQKLRADINGDGKINATDYMLLKRAVLGTYKIA